MLTRCQETGQWIKTYFVPSYLAITQLATTTAQTLYALPKFSNYLIGTEQFPYRLPLSLLACYGNATAIIASRTHGLFNHFNSEQKDEEVPISTCTGNVFVVVVQMMAIASTLFSVLGIYFFSMFLIESFIEVVSPSQKNHQENNVAIQLMRAIALSFFIGKFFSNYTFVYKRAKLNTSRLVHHFENNDDPFDFDKRALALSSIGTLFSIVPIPFYAYFATSASLEKIPYVTVPEQIKDILCAVSAVTAAVTFLATSPVSLYNTIKKKREVVASTGCKVSPLDGLVYPGLTVDSLGTTIGNVTAFAFTSQRVFGFDPKSHVVLGIGAACSTAAALLSFFQNYESNKEWRSSCQVMDTVDPSESPKIEFIDEKDEADKNVDTQVNGLYSPIQFHDLPADQLEEAIVDLDVEVKVSRHHATHYGQSSRVRINASVKVTIEEFDEPARADCC